MATDFWNIYSFLPVLQISAITTPVLIIYILYLFHFYTRGTLAELWFFNVYFTVDLATYLTRFQWDMAKYPIKQSLKSIADIIAKVSPTIDNTLEIKRLVRNFGFFSLNPLTGYDPVSHKWDTWFNDDGLLWIICLLLVARNLMLNSKLHRKPILLGIVHKIISCPTYIKKWFGQQSIEIHFFKWSTSYLVNKINTSSHMITDLAQILLLLISVGWLIYHWESFIFESIQLSISHHNFDELSGKHCKASKIIVLFLGVFQVFTFV